MLLVPTLVLLFACLSLLAYIGRTSHVVKFRGLRSLRCLSAGSCASQLLAPANTAISTLGSRRRLTESQGPHGMLIVMGSNHKTGTSLETKLMGALARAAAKRNHTTSIINLESSVLSSTLDVSGVDVTLVQDPHCDGLPTYSERYCFVNMVRDPIHLVVSAYMYHLRLGKRRPYCGSQLCEGWLYEPSKHCPWIAGSDISFYEKLVMAQKISDLEGLRCQLDSSRWNVRKMVLCFEAANTKPNAVQFNMESAVENVNDTVARIYNTCKMDSVLPLGAWTDEYTYKEARHMEELSGSGRSDLHVNSDHQRALELRQVLLDSHPDFHVELGQMQRLLTFLANS